MAKEGDMYWTMTLHAQASGIFWSDPDGTELINEGVCFKCGTRDHLKLRFWRKRWEGETVYCTRCLRKIVEGVNGGL